MVAYLFFRIILAFYSLSFCSLRKKLCQKKTVIAKKAYVAIVRGYKILSSKSRTRRIFLVNEFSGSVPVPYNKNIIVPFDQ